MKRTPLRLARLFTLGLFLGSLPFTVLRAVGLIDSKSGIPNLLLTVVYFTLFCFAMALFEREEVEDEGPQD